MAANKLEKPGRAGRALGRLGQGERVETDLFPQNTSKYLQNSCFDTLQDASPTRWCPTNLSDGVLSTGSASRIRPIRHLQSPTPSLRRSLPHTGAHSRPHTGPIGRSKISPTPNYLSFRALKRRVRAGGVGFAGFLVAAWEMGCGARQSRRAGPLWPPGHPRTRALNGTVSVTHPVTSL